MGSVADRSGATGLGPGALLRLVREGRAVTLAELVEQVGRERADVRSAGVGLPAPRATGPTRACAALLARASAAAP
jgi:hypothetical protein